MLHIVFGFLQMTGNESLDFGLSRYSKHPVKTVFLK